MSERENNDVMTRKQFTLQNIIVICGFVIQGVSFWFMMNNKIDSIVAEGKADVKINDMRFNAIEKTLEIHDLAIRTLTQQYARILENEDADFRKYRK